MGLTVMLDASRGGSLCCSAMLGQVYWLGIYDSAGSCTLSQALGETVLASFDLAEQQALGSGGEEMQLVPPGNRSSSENDIRLDASIAGTSRFLLPVAVHCALAAL